MLSGQRAFRRGHFGRDHSGDIERGSAGNKHGEQAHRAGSRANCAVVWRKNRSNDFNRHEILRSSRGSIRNSATTGSTVSAQETVNETQPRKWLVPLAAGLLLLVVGEREAGYSSRRWLRFTALSTINLHLKRL